MPLTAPSIVVAVTCMSNEEPPSAPLGSQKQWVASQVQMLDAQITAFPQGDISAVGGGVERVGIGRRGVERQTSAKRGASARRIVGTVDRFAGRVSFRSGAQRGIGLAWDSILGVERNTEAGDRNIDAGDRNTEADDRNTEAGDRNTEADDRNTEAGDRNTEAGDRNTDADDRPTEAGDRKTVPAVPGSSTPAPLGVRPVRYGCFSCSYAAAIRRVSAAISARRLAGSSTTACSPKPSTQFVTSIVPRAITVTITRPSAYSSTR